MALVRSFGHKHTCTLPCSPCRDCLRAVPVHTCTLPPPRCVSLRLGLGEQAPAVHELRKLLGGDFARWGRSVDVHFWCRHKKHDSSRAVHNASKTAVHHASKAVHESGKMALI